MIAQHRERCPLAASEPTEQTDCNGVGPFFNSGGPLSWFADRRLLPDSRGSPRIPTEAGEKYGQIGEGPQFGASAHRRSPARSRRSGSPRKSLVSGRSRQHIEVAVAVDIRRHLASSPCHDRTAEIGRRFAGRGASFLLNRRDRAAHSASNGFPSASGAVKGRTATDDDQVVRVRIPRSLNGQNRPCREVRPAPQPVANTVTAGAQPCATPGRLVPTPASLLARGHLGVGAGTEVRPQTRGAARCHRKSTLDPPYRLLHTRCV